MAPCQERKPENKKFYIFFKNCLCYYTYTISFEGKFMFAGELQGNSFEPDVNGLNLAFWIWEGERNIPEGNLLNLMRSKGLKQTVQNKNDCKALVTASLLLSH